MKLVTSEEFSLQKKLVLESFKTFVLLELSSTLSRWNTTLAESLSYLTTVSRKKKRDCYSLYFDRTILGTIEIQLKISAKKRELLHRLGFTLTRAFYLVLAWYLEENLVSWRQKVVLAI